VRFFLFPPVGSSPRGFFFLCVAYRCSSQLVLAPLVSFFSFSIGHLCLRTSCCTREVYSAFFVPLWRCLGVVLDGVSRCPFFLGFVCWVCVVMLLVVGYLGVGSVCGFPDLLFDAGGAAIVYCFFFFGCVR